MAKFMYLFRHQQEGRKQPSRRDAAAHEIVDELA